MSTTEKPGLYELIQNYQVSSAIATTLAEDVAAYNALAESAMAQIMETIKNGRSTGNKVLDWVMVAYEDASSATQIWADSIVEIVGKIIKQDSNQFFMLIEKSLVQEDETFRADESMWLARITGNTEHHVPKPGEPWILPLSTPVVTYGLTRPCRGNTKLQAPLTLGGEPHHLDIRLLNVPLAEEGSALACDDMGNANFCYEILIGAEEIAAWLNKHNPIYLKTSYELEGLLATPEGQPA